MSLVRSTLSVLPAVLDAGPGDLEPGCLVSRLAKLIDAVPPGTTVIQNTSTRNERSYGLKMRGQISPNTCKTFTNMERNVFFGRQVSYVVLLIFFLIEAGCFPQDRPSGIEVRASIPHIAGAAKSCSSIAQ